jgi:ribonuclease HI
MMSGVLLFFEQVGLAESHEQQYMLNLHQQELFKDSNGTNKNKFTYCLCQPCNPGGTAFIIKNEEGNTIHSGYGLAARNSTNNVAEYTGIIKALEWLLANNYENENIVIKGDSLLVINQIERNFKAPNIIPLYRKAMSIISEFKDIQVEWISRGQNYGADKLSYRAYEEMVHHQEKTDSVETGYE